MLPQAVWLIRHCCGFAALLLRVVELLLPPPPWAARSGINSRHFALPLPCDAAPCLQMFITPAVVGGSTAIPALYHQQDADKERSYAW